MCMVKDMRELVAVLTLLATAAWAGESLLGIIMVTDAGTGTNRTAAAAAAAPTTFINGSKCSAGFEVTPLTKISVQCDEAAFVATDAAGCDAGTCVELAAKQFFTSTVNSSKTLTARAWSWDAGAQSTPCVVTYTGGWVAVSPVGGASRAVCRVFSRKGDE